MLEKHAGVQLDCEAFRLHYSLTHFTITTQWFWCYWYCWRGVCSAVAANVLRRNRSRCSASLARLGAMAQKTFDCSDAGDEALCYITSATFSTLHELTENMPAVYVKRWGAAWLARGYKVSVGNRIASTNVLRSSFTGYEGSWNDTSASFY